MALHFSRAAFATLGGAFGLASILTLVSQPGTAQVQVLPAFVRLQASTPGTAQIGHSNVTGTAIAGQFKGGGAGLTGVNADALDGIDSTAFLQAVPNPLLLSGAPAGSPVISGTNNATSSGSSGIFGESTSSTGTTFGGRFESQSTSGRGVSGIAESATGLNYGVFGQTNSDSGRAVFGNGAAGSGDSIGVYGQTLSTTGTGVFGTATDSTGINFGVRGETPSTSGRAVFGSATAISGSNYGGYFENSSTDGIGVFGFGIASSGSNFGGFFQTRSSAGTGVQGLAMSLSGPTVGVFGQSESTSGRAVFGSATATTGLTYGGRFESDSSTGRGVFGFATASTGTTYGVSGQSNSTSGRGAYGIATASVGQTYGVYGSSASISGVGVFGTASATTGTALGGRFESDSVNGTGVYGYATSATGNTYGVYGKTESSSAFAFAVYAMGNMGAQGLKPFRIDHPADPENQYLLHYSTEGPEVMNFYSGKAVLDGSGQAVVELPSYFALINKDPRYLLTAVGAPMPNLYVAQEVSEEALATGANTKPGTRAPRCSFRIAGGKAGMKVSWRVEAVRNDAWMQKNGAPVEVEKEGPERGKYQRPELYGKPASMGMDYDPKRQVSGETRASRP